MVLSSLDMTQALMMMDTREKVGVKDILLKKKSLCQDSEAATIFEFIGQSFNKQKGQNTLTNKKMICLKLLSLSAL